MLQENKKIDAVSSIQQGFRIAGMNWGLNIAFLIVSFVIAGVVGLIPFVSSVFNAIIAPIISFGFVIVAHKMVNNERVEFGNYFDGFKKVGPMITANLLKVLVAILFALPLLWICYDSLGGYEGILNLINQSTDPDENLEKLMTIKDAFLGNMALIILFGLVAMIPGILLAFTLFFVWFKGDEPVEALKNSSNLVKDNLLQLIVFGILMFVIFIISLIPCGFGLLFSIPALACATYAAFASVTDLNKTEMDTTDHFITNE